MEEAPHQAEGEDPAAGLSPRRGARPSIKLLQVKDLEERFRIMIGTGIVQSGYCDQDEETGTIDVLEWHRCLPECEGHRCGCSGIPYLSQEIWNTLDRFEDLQSLMNRINTAIVQAHDDGYQLAVERLEGEADYWQ